MLFSTPAKHLSKRVLRSQQTKLTVRSHSILLGQKQSNKAQRIGYVKVNATQKRMSSNSPVSTPFIMADIGEGISEVEVLQWYVKEGDMVEQFTPLCEVQSDKATVPISSRYEGKITKIYYPQGTIAKVGTPLCDILTKSSEDLKEEVKANQQANQATCQASKPREASEFEKSFQARGDQPNLSENSKVLASPAVRFLAKKEKIDLTQLQGKGRGGMITKTDLIEYINNKNKPSSPIASPVAETRPIPEATLSQTTTKPASVNFLKTHPIPNRLVQDEEEALKGFKKAMAVTMNESLSIPHFGYCDEIDVSNLIEVREKLKQTTKDNGVSLSYLPFFVKAASLAMESYPLINSMISKDLKTITRLAHHNIAIAIATPTGLVVPNIKNVETLSLLEIAQEIQRIVGLANANKLSASDLSGSTFSLSNIGSIGGTYASPVLVSPQVVIGALGKFQKLPRFDNQGNVVAAHIMNVSWSGDHRVIDGATIALFSNLFKDYLENPALMLLHLK